MRTALLASGYEVELCPPDVLTNASSLDKAMRKFCAGGEADDIRILYFTGHGLLADNVDWIIPAETSRKDATFSPNQRVSTDLSLTVADSKVGLVIFIIDACRDRADIPVTKGGASWGDPARLARPAEHRFIRFFGCAAGQVCQVLPPNSDQLASSLFTRALTDSLSDGTCVSLDDLLPQVANHCRQLVEANAFLQSQAPRLSLSDGELSEEARKILKRPVFNRVNVPVMTPTWGEFDPTKMQCLVVISEYEHNKQRTVPHWWGLRDLVRDALAGETGDRIWKSFRSGCHGQKLVSGRYRDLPENKEPAAVLSASVSVIDALSSADAFDGTVRAVVEADLVAFDVTGFEPAVMLLIGIRSACRRSVSVCSHGNGWKEGDPLEVPFNLQDLNISSHTPTEIQVGKDPVVERFVHRVETGFSQQSKHPLYLDLPGYDSLRELGSDYAASSTIDVVERILVLCSYDRELFHNWRSVASGLKQALSNKRGIAPAIERIIDYGTPQLVRQSLYEQIRRTAACVVDWSKYSPSVFVELGARLAISEWGAVQIIDSQYLPEGQHGPELEQVERMRRLFNPIAYSDRPASDAAFEAMAELLLDRTPNLDDDQDYNRVHRAVLEVIGTVQPTYPELVSELRREAEALHHPSQGREGAPQILFYGSRSIKQDTQNAARERRIAAWLYLEHRVRASGKPMDADTLKDYQDLGRSSKDALYELGEIKFAQDIEERLKQVG
jgi:hypothetical protein